MELFLGSFISAALHEHAYFPGANNTINIKGKTALDKSATQACTLKCQSTETLVQNMFCSVFLWFFF